MFSMLEAAFLAWPSTSSLLLVCLFNFAIFSYVALRYELPVVHAIGLPCLAVLFLTTIHVSDNNLSFDMFGAPDTGMALAVFFLLLGVGGEGLARSGRKADSPLVIFCSPGGCSFWF